VENEPGRKADLDKEGIEFQDTGKAELDKDGISLETEESQAHADMPEPKSDQEPEKITASKKRLILMAGAGAAALLVLLGAIGFFFLHGDQKVTKNVAKVEKPHKVSPFGPDGMVLDPFMVFYSTTMPKKSGVLVAQVSLKVDPSVITSIQSKLFDIRNIIYKRLLAAASVYSQTEITLMLSDDLMDYPIQEVAFVQYSAK
jgi:flagellar basal body-associated protein FliL